MQDVSSGIQKVIDSGTGQEGIEAMMDLQLNFRSSTGTYQSQPQQTGLADLPKTLEGLEINGKLIGQGTHSRVVLGSYYLTPVAIKEFFDIDAFQKEYCFY